MTTSQTGPFSTRYDTLLDYLASQQQRHPGFIQHPDPHVNRMAMAQLDSLRKAAVLIPVTRNSATQESHVVLTVRSANLKSHAGQISLPGGTWEARDADAVSTALRESEEEIGLRRDAVEIIGQLGEMALPSGFRVTPVIGLIEPGLQFTPCPVEVADIFQAPLELVLNPEAYRRSEILFNEQPRQILELLFEDYRIWGATANILHHLAEAVTRHATMPD